MSRRSNRRAAAAAAARASAQGNALTTTPLPPTGPTFNPGVGQVAPAPMTDKTPVVIGSELTMAYISSVYRIGTSGYRQQLVDLLNELLERDPATYCVLSQRILAVACGRVELQAAVTDKTSSDYDEAQEICEDVSRRFEAIPRRTQAFASLLWAIYYGPTALENMYDRRDDGWSITELSLIVSRRIAYPEPGTWRPFIWDLGAVFPISYGIGNQTEVIRPWGIPFDAYPGKFVLHTPALRGDYPSRDGLGREIGFWMALKGMGARSAGDFIERFAKPWVLGTYSTAANNMPRSASEADKLAGAAAQRGIGAGSLSGAMLPDSIKIALQGPGFSGSVGSLTQDKFIQLIDDQITKCVRGGTLTTGTGDHGSRALGEVHDKNDVRNARYDARVFADTIKADMVRPLTRLNHPGREHLTPHVIVHVEQQDPDAVLNRAVKACSIGMPVDGRPLSKEVGLKLVEPDDEHAIRLGPVKMVDPSELLTAEERAEQAKRDAAFKVANPPPTAAVALPPARQDGPGAAVDEDADAAADSVDATLTDWPQPIVRRTFNGFPIAIENAAGSERLWHDRDGSGRVVGSTTMRHHYGFIEGHIGSDGEELDCYLGPYEDAPLVYVVHQLASPDFKSHDEDKTMLGFASADEAKAAYLAHRNDGERAFGGMSTIPVDVFRRKLKRRTGTGKIRASDQLAPPHNGASNGVAFTTTPVGFG